MLIGLLLALPAESVAAPPSAAPAVAAKKKKCKGGRVRVKIGKHVTCRPARKVLPKPRAGDQRLIVTRAVVGGDFSRLRNRRGKRAPSLPKLVRKLGPRAPALLSRMTSRGVARLDALAVAAGPRAFAAAAGCNGAQGAQQQSSFTSSDGGTSATVTATLGPDGAAMVLELSGNGMTVTLDLDLGLCDPNELEAPQCPTAAGQLDGQIRYSLRVAVKVTRGTADVWSQAVEVKRKTRLQGFTEVDAKLDQLDVDDVETSTVALGGGMRGFPPISIRTRIARHTQVDMRSGSYEPGRSDIQVSVDTAGLGGPDRAEVEDGLAERGRAAADNQFRAIVDKAIAGYRSRETAWQTPKKCAQLRFSPAPNTVRLRRSQQGSFTATAIAKQDGNPSELDARLSSPVNATFSPARAGGQRARFEYRVTGTARDRVKATIRATSKAGVDEETWQQPVDVPAPLPTRYGGTVSGTGVYDATELGTGNSLRGTWSATFMALKAAMPPFPGSTMVNYQLLSGSLHYNFTGHVGDCEVAGSGSIDLGAQPDLQGVAVLAVFDEVPRRYQLQLPMPLSGKVTGTKSDCEDPDDEGDDFDWFVAAGLPAIAFAPLPGGPVGADWKITGTRSGDTGPGSPDQTWQWSLIPAFN